MLPRLRHASPGAARRHPLLTRPFEAATTGWCVVGAAIVIEVAGGAIALRSAPVVSLPLFLTPVLVAYGVAVTQWWQVRVTGTDSASWWHEAGVVAALLLWYLAPRAPTSLSSVHNARAACLTLPVPSMSDCVERAAHAFDYANAAWWSALGLIGAAALLARRSRIAPWAAIPTALAGCILANNMLEQLLVHFQVSG